MTIDTELSERPSSARSTELVVFDFDETIVECDSDTYINVLAPGGTIPDSIWNNYQCHKEWNTYMRQVFAYMHENGVTEEDYKQCLATIPFVNSMESLLRNLAKGTEQKKFEVIIISDANTFFIHHILECNKLEHVFQKIFTNGASFDETGHLRLRRFHEQDWCQLSARNLCKGQILEKYITGRLIDGVNFDRINYAGDGANDLCPSLRLSQNDRVFPRAGFPLHRLVNSRVESKELRAQVFPYANGDDIWKVLTGSQNDTFSQY